MNSDYNDLVKLARLLDISEQGENDILSAYISADNQQEFIDDLRAQTKESYEILMSLRKNIYQQRDDPKARSRLRELSEKVEKLSYMANVS